MHSVGMCDDWLCQVGGQKYRTVLYLKLFGGKLLETAKGMLSVEVRLGSWVPYDLERTLFL